MWWRHFPGYKAYVEARFAGSIDPDTFKLDLFEKPLEVFLEEFGLASEVTILLNRYGSDYTLTVDQLATMLYDWAYDYIDLEKPWWHTLTHAELFGGMRDGFFAKLTGVDQNQDGSITAEELLMTLQHPDIDAILEKHGKHCMWWHSYDFFEDAFVGHVDKSYGGSLDKDEFHQWISGLTEDLSSLSDKIYEEFTSDPVAGMTSGEFGNMMWHWAHGQLSELEDRTFPQETVDAVYAEFSDVLHHAVTALGLIDGLE